MTKCNKCGIEEKRSSSNNESYADLNLCHHFECEGEYISYFLSDLNKYYFVICEKCLRQMFEEFKIPPEISDYSDGSMIPYKDDSRWFHYQEWQRTGGHKEAYKNKKCNAKKDCPNDAMYTILNSDLEFDFNSICEECKNKELYQNSQMVKFIPHYLQSFI